MQEGKFDPGGGGICITLLAMYYNIYTYMCTGCLVTQTLLHKSLWNFLKTNRPNDYGIINTLLSCNSMCAGAAKQIKEIHIKVTILPKMLLL